jgi:CBS domain-containing protein
MKAQDIMSKNPTCVTPDTTLADAARLMKNENIGIVPVVESASSRRLVGVVTDRDIAIRAVAQGLGPDAKVGQAMSREVQWCYEDTAASEVLQKMADEQIRRMPVLSREKRLVGIVSLGDLTDASEARDAGAALCAISRHSDQHSQALH